MSGLVKGKFPPGPSPASRSGSFRNYSRDPLGFLPNLAREYGDIVTMRFYKFRVYYVNHPDYIEEVLVNQARKFIKGRILRANKGRCGNGLLTSEGDVWLRQRRLAQSAFHRARIAAYAETMVRFTERMQEGWRDGQTLDIHAEMTRLTLQIVAKTLFDADVDADAQEVGRALEAIMEHNSDFRRLILTPSWLPTLRNIRAALATRRLNKIMYRIIGQRRTAGQDAGDLLSMLLHAQDEDGSRMTDRQLRDEPTTLFLAGPGPTPLALSVTVWVPPQHPHAEGKLHRDIHSVLGGRPPTPQHLLKPPHLGHAPPKPMLRYPPRGGMAGRGAS